VKKFLFSLAALGLTLIAAAAAPAQDSKAGDNKPLLVMSLPSVDALMKDLEYLGKVTGAEALHMKFEDAIDMYAGGLKGLDRGKSIGLAATTDGANFQFLAFLPATDADALIALSPMPAEDVGDGLKKISTPFGRDIFLKTKGSWLLASNEASSLATVPADPAKLLDGMDKQYDLGVRIYMQNIPPAYKGMAVGAIRLGASQGMARKKPGESEESYASRKKLVNQQIDALVKTINELDQITLGWSVDAPAKKLVMEISATAKEGSDTAKKYAEQKDLRSNFAGFWKDDAVFSALAAAKVTEDEAAQLIGTLEQGEQAILKEIDKSDDFENEAQKAKVKEVVVKVWDVLESTIKAGQVDVGMTVLGEGPFTLAVGMGVADGAAADKALRDAIKIAEDEEVLAKVEYEAHKAGDVTFHVISPKLADSGEDVISFLGADPKIVVATGKKSLYFALGTGAVKTLEDLIEKSKAAAGRPVPPGQMVLSLAPILKFAAKHDPDNPIVPALAESLTPGSDRIRISSKLIPNGESSRLEIDEGVVKMIGSALMMFRGGFGAAAPGR